MIAIDDRTEAQRQTLRCLIIGTDRILSGWGHADNGASVAAWATTPEHADRVEAWVRSRGDMLRVRYVYEDPRRPYRPRNAAHYHCYVVTPNHNALKG